MNFQTRYLHYSNKCVQIGSKCSVVTNYDGHSCWIITEGDIKVSCLKQKVHQLMDL